MREVDGERSREDGDTGDGEHCGLAEEDRECGECGVDEDDMCCSWGWPCCEVDRGGGYGGVRGTARVEEDCERTRGGQLPGLVGGCPDGEAGSR